MCGFSMSLSSAIIRPTGTQLDYRSRTLFGGHEKVASAAMGSGVPLGRARTDVSSMNAPLPNAVWHIRPRTGSERSLHFEGGPAPVCRAARLRLIYDGKSRFTPQARSEIGRATVRDSRGI